MNDLLIGAWLGFLTCLQLATAGATAYILRRYVYLPWKTVRADQTALAIQIQNVINDLGARKVGNIDPNNQAIAEQKQRMARAMRGLVVEDT